MDDYKIEFKDLCMEFPGVKALDEVSFGIKKGAVHVLMGENGAGKSTLMKILNGAYIPTSGKFFIDGKEQHFKTMLDSENCGIAMIHQELSYMPDMSVERYLMMCREVRKGFVINWAKTSAEAQKLLDKEGLNYNRRELLRNMSVSDIQLLEITRAINQKNIDILIMDEPTSALSTSEVDRLFDNIKRLKERGLTIIYISHKMDEIFRIADYITVLRDGHHIKTGPTSEFTEDSLVKLMVGREISNVYPKKDPRIGKEVLRVENLTCNRLNIHNISFSVHEGEILGLGGLMGAGRTETVRCIYGLEKYDSGSIYINGQKVKIHSATDAIKQGIVLATEDRRRYGLVLCRNIKENISLSSLGRISKGSVINNKKERKITLELFDTMKIKAPGLDTLTLTLSGGNQQKVVLSKCLMTQAKIIILDEPTRGIDVGAKYEIYKLMVELAQQGKAIIFISSETPEFIGMTDSACVLYKGKVTGYLDRKELTQEKLITLSVGGTCNGN